MLPGARKVAELDVHDPDVLLADEVEQLADFTRLGDALLGTGAGDGGHGVLGARGGGSGPLVRCPCAGPGTQGHRVSCKTGRPWSRRFAIMRGAVSARRVHGSSEPRGGRLHGLSIRKGSGSVKEIVHFLLNLANTIAKNGRLPV